MKKAAVAKRKSGPPTPIRSTETAKGRTATKTADDRPIGFTTKARSPLRRTIEYIALNVLEYQDLCRTCRTISAAKTCPSFWPNLIPSSAAQSTPITLLGR